jgi:hypothetical protein
MMFLKNRTYAPISDSLKEQLLRVEPSVDRQMEYRPCKVILKNGKQLDFVYVCKANMYIRPWGVWPEDDRGKKSILIQDVQEIAEYPLRLPVRFANKMHQAGELGMGYYLFSIVLADGRKFPYVTGNAVDFINLPERVTPEMIVDLLPHEGRSFFKNRKPNFYETNAEYYWCLFSDPHG